MVGRCAYAPVICSLLWYVMVKFIKNLAMDCKVFLLQSVTFYDKMKHIATIKGVLYEYSFYHKSQVRSGKRC